MSTIQVKCYGGPLDGGLATVAEDATGFNYVQRLDESEEVRHDYVKAEDTQEFVHMRQWQ